MLSRAHIVTFARSYVGTPFRHQGRERARAVDCVGLILCVAEDLSLVDVDGRPFQRRDYLHYGPQPTDAFIHEECGRRMHPVWPGSPLLPVESVLEPGDVITMRVPTVPCHIGFVSELPASQGAMSLPGGLGIIHAYAGAGKVVEHRLDAKWLRRIAGVFQIPRVA